VDDTVTGHGRHLVTLRWHLAPGTRLRLEPGGAVVTGPAGEVAVAVTANGEPALAAVTAPVSAGFGRTVQAPVLACTLHHELPVTISTVWRRTASRQETA
jgi:Heparinase II/III-like protein